MSDNGVSGVIVAAGRRTAWERLMNVFIQHGAQ